MSKFSWTAHGCRGMWYILPRPLSRCQLLDYRYFVKPEISRFTFGFISAGGDPLSWFLVPPVHKYRAEFGIQLQSSGDEDCIGWIFKKFIYWIFETSTLSVSIVWNDPLSFQNGCHVVVSAQWGDTGSDIWDQASQSSTARPTRPASRVSSFRGQDRF